MRPTAQASLLAAVALLGAASGAAAQAAEAAARYYRVEEIALPEGLDAQVGGMDFFPDGRLAASFHSGEVYLFDPRTERWTLFAEGLHEPLGVLVEETGSLLVMQKPELTRISDTDGDGRADRFDTVSDHFGFTGNYHEFAYGPVRDAQGNLYISLNLASTGAGIMEEVRGEFRSLSASREAVEKRKFPNKMYSVVPYRGWVLRITPEGETVPFASGFRSPNGLLLDARGRLFVNDNQGDWLGTSKLYHVEQGKFYGHPVSLIWKPGWRRDPLELDPLELDRMRTREVLAYPHQLVANSPTQQVLVPEGAFPPFGGQMIVGEMDQPRLLRVLLEEVGGELQGAVVPLIDGSLVGQGNNRLAFAPDGSLWVGKTHLKWAGSTGIQRIVPTGELPMELQGIRLTADGFDLTFTRPVRRDGAPGAAAPAVRRYYYAYHQDYGSPQLDTATVEVTRTEVSADGRRVRVRLADLRPGYQYELDLSGIRAADKTPVLNPLVVYTLNRLVDGTGPAVGFGVGLPEKPAAGGDR